MDTARITEYDEEEAKEVVKEIDKKLLVKPVEKQEGDHLFEFEQTFNPKFTYQDYRLAKKPTLRNKEELRLKISTTRSRPL